MAVGQGGSCRGGEHRADVDGHIEEAEGGITLGRIFRVIVQIAHEHLQVAFEEARTHGDQQQGAYHQGEGEAAAGECVRRYGEAQVAGEHHAYACDDALAETDLVCQPAADYRHKIDCSEENCVKLTGSSCGKTEFGLQEEQEDG